LSENQKDWALERKIRKSAMWSLATSYRDDITRKREPKWNSASVGCYEATTDFGSHFGIHSPNAINVTIVGTLDVDSNANYMIDYVLAGTFFVDLSSPTK
jgi:hypothetical protein